MNARFLLLVIVTGLFMAAWDGDQAAMEAAIARRESRIQNARLLLAQSNDQTNTVQVVQTTADTTHPVTLTGSRPEDKGSAVAAEEVPLPPRIAAGEYRVVDQLGRTTMIEIAKEDATSDHSMPMHSFMDDQGNPWYFIRVATR